ALAVPQLDPTPIFEVFRGSYGTELLTAAVAHFRVFERLAAGPLPFAQLREQLGLAERPAVGLLTALRAFGLGGEAPPGKLNLSELAGEHLLPGGPFDVSDYIGLAADSPGVLALVERLKSNRPAGAGPQETGAAFIYRDGLASAMEDEGAARRLT